ncbi:MAG: hypothetical protein QXH00_11130 [Candidatus Jordarchaeales archaeon]
MGTTIVEYWPKSRFKVPNPVCDLCSTPLTDFPAPVVIHPFDYIMMRFMGNRLVGGYIMRGGLAMCRKCFETVMKELREKGETIIER